MSGAKLLVLATGNIPNEFRLRIAGDDSEYLAEVRWLQKIVLGVQLKRPIDAAALDICRVQSTCRWLAA
jgi:hypothetical protein